MRLGRVLGGWWVWERKVEKYHAGFWCVNSCGVWEVDENFFIAFSKTFNFYFYVCLFHVNQSIFYSILMWHNKKWERREHTSTFVISFKLNSIRFKKSKTFHSTKGNWTWHHQKPFFFKYKLESSERRPLEAQIEKLKFHERFKATASLCVK